MKCVDDFRLKLNGKEYVPIVIGGMGVDISTEKLALEAVMGGYGHTRFREFLLGGVTRTVLGDATMPVLMSH